MRLRSKNIDIRKVIDFFAIDNAFMPSYENTAHNILYTCPDVTGNTYDS